MKFTLSISSREIARIRAFFEGHRHDPFVRLRIDRNLRGKRPDVRRDTVWRVLVVCLTTTQQHSGPGTAVDRFEHARPFPLAYGVCRKKRDLRSFASTKLKAGGLRRHQKIGAEVENAYRLLEDGFWDELITALRGLSRKANRERERKVAELIAARLPGFGPKQSRNLIQALGLSRYEIPIDSRVTKWLNRYGFPFPVSAKALADPGYYGFVLDCFQAVCKEVGVLPCVLDAAIFTAE